MPSLKDKVALITGASSGLGAGVALHFATLGARLALNGRNVTALEDISAKCQEDGLQPDSVLLLPGDLTNDDDTKHVVEKTILHFKRLDILVHSAGILTFGSIENLQMKSYDQCMNINLRSVVHLTHLAIPHLLNTKGNVVIISGTTGIRGAPHLLAVSMAKAALNSLTQVLALDLASKGVRVNSVNPGVVQTQLHLRGGMPEEDFKKYLEHSGRVTHPLGRIGTVEDVAKAVTFLASDQAEFITGVNLPVDGGRILALPR